MPVGQVFCLYGSATTRSTDHDKILDPNEPSCIVTKHKQETRSNLAQTVLFYFCDPTCSIFL